MPLNGYHAGMDQKPSDRRESFHVDFLGDYTEEAIISELRRLADLNEGNVTKALVNKHARVSYATINKRFGSLRHALQQASLQHNRFMNASDDELIEILQSLWAETLETEGRHPFKSDVRAALHGVSADTISRRFGGWRKALIAASNPSTKQSGSAKELVVESTARPQERRALSLRKRFQVLQRDGFTCQLCGACGAGVRLEVDHRQSVADGGADTLENLWTLCFDCNRGKRDTSLP